MFACRDSFREMLRSIAANGHTFEQCKAALVASAYCPYLSSVSGHLRIQISALILALSSFINGARRMTFR